MGYGIGSGNGSGSSFGSGEFDELMQLQIDSEGRTFVDGPPMHLFRHPALIQALLEQAGGQALKDANACTCPLQKSSSAAPPPSAGDASPLQKTSSAALPSARATPLQKAPSAVSAALPAEAPPPPPPWAPWENRNYCYHLWTGRMIQIQPPRQLQEQQGFPNWTSYD